VVHLATALDHLTVLEFGEPVTMAAAGSQAFQIERHEDKVFIKPLKTGASTDLFIWTASRRFTYELESPGEVTHMTFAVDNRPPAPKPPDASQQLDAIADMVLTRAFLGAERIDSSLIKDAKHGVTLRIEQVFTSRSTVYIHYAIRNLGPRRYEVRTPKLEQLLPVQSTVSVPALRGRQLNRAMAKKLGQARAVPLAIAHTETSKGGLEPGDETQGVIAIRQNLDGPTVLKIRFPGDDDTAVEALVVL
jgi:hypothetical protein